MGGTPAVWIFYALVFVAILTLVEGVLLLVAGDRVGRRRVANERLRRHATRLSEEDLSEGGILIDSEERAPLAAFIARLLPRRRSLELLLYRAGMPYTPPQFVLLTLGVALGGLALGTLVLGSLPLGLVLSAVFGLAPLGRVHLRRRTRMRKFEMQLPEALDLMCRALRAGISLEFGFRSVGDELDDPVGTEFGQVADEVSLGLDTRVALQNLALRMNTSDMPFFINAILIQRETGGNLAEILNNLATVIRERIKFYGKVKALLAQTQLTANLLGVLPIVVFAGTFVLRPGYLEPLFVPPGQYILIGAAVLVPVGWLMCRRIASIDA
jgi:tight adherence protein B